MDGLLYTSITGKASVTRSPSQAQRERRQANGIPPHYSFPQSFNVGGKDILPLVSSDQLKAHLALLRLFHGLRRRAEDTEFSQVFPTPSESLKDRRWAFFVSFAVKRFEIWSESIASKLRAVDELLIPPVDVLMVWHAYRLNPGWYLEDALRIPAIIFLEGKAGSLFKTLFNEGDISIFRFLEESNSSSQIQAQVRQWIMLTETPFDPFEGIVSWAWHTLTCPHCESKNITALLTPDGTGYLQKLFNHRCTACLKPFNHEALAVMKFASDLTREDGSNRGLLAGTLLTPLNGYNVEGAEKIRTTIRTFFESDRRQSLYSPQWKQIIGRACGWSKADLVYRVGKLTVYNGERVKLKMMSAYVDDRLFSVDLVGATLRQASFVEKMHKLRWTEPGRFSLPEDEIALLHCIARYHAFLDLFSTTPASFFVPTLDIDLAWHTHQLFTEDYNNDTRSYIGRFIDHDDKIEEDKLANAFDITCRAWEARFNVQYSLCGCPMPDQKKSLFSLKSKQKAPSHLLPPKREDLLAGTHASEHNGVIVLSNDPALTRDNINEVRRRRGQREEKQQKRQEKAAERRRDRRYSMGTDPFWGSPFIYPVPVHYYSASCSAVAGAVYSGCSSGNCTGSAGGGSGACGGGDSGRGSSCGGGCGGGCGGD